MFRIEIIQNSVAQMGWLDKISYCYYYYYYCCGHCYYFSFYYYYHYCYYYSRLGTHENDDGVGIKYANT